MKELSPVARAADDRGEDPEGAEERPGVDADGHVLGDVGEALVVGGDVDNAGPGVIGDAVARVVPVGPGHAVARDAAKDDLGIQHPQVVVPDAAPGQCARPHGLDHHVGTRGQLLQDGNAGVGAQVEHERALASVEVQVHQRRALHDGPRHFADVVAGGRFHLDHVGPEVDQRRGDGGRSQRRALDDPQSVQGWRCRHRSSSRRRPDRSGRRPGHSQPVLAILGRWNRRFSMTR